MRGGTLWLWLGALLALLALAPAVTAAPRPGLANVAEFPKPRGSKLILGPEGRSLYAAAGDRLLTYARDPNSTRLDLISDSETGGTATVLSPDGRFAYTAAHQYGSEPPRLEVLSRDPVTGLLTHQHTLGSGDAITTMAIAPDGRDIYALPLGYDPRVIRFVRDPASGLVARAGEVSLDPRISQGLAIKVAPDGRDVFVAGLNGGSQLRRDVATGALTPLDDPAANPTGTNSLLDVAVSREGGRVYRGGGMFSLHARDPASGELSGLTVERPPCERDYPLACVNGIVQPSPDGQLVAALASDEFRLSLLESTPGGARHLRDWTWGDDHIDSMMSVHGVEWSPDSRMLYVLGAALGVWVREGDGRSLRFAGEGKLPNPFSSPTPPGVEIVDEPRYVRSSRVSVEVGSPAGASSVRLANEPSMRGAPARRLGTSRRIPWRLRPGKRGRATVYARYMTRPGAKAAVRQAQTYSVVVDAARPRIQRARLRKGALLLRARDARSGVRSVQVTSRRSRPGKVRRYKGRLAVKGRPRTVWVRVIDKAGNKSRWKRVKRR